MLIPGLYEQVINNELRSELETLEEERRYTEKIDSAEATDILSSYAAERIKSRLKQIAEGKDNDVPGQVALVNKVLGVLAETETEKDDTLVDNKAEQLLAVLSDQDPLVKIKRKTAKDVVRPETSVSQSSLFTGSSQEPEMYSELKKEIITADRIDMLVSFIKWSGLRLIIDELRAFTDQGGSLRVITTSYMGATQIKAVEEINNLKNTELKISYDTKRTRLHAKAYVFHRESGFTTAYVGSSNLSRAAMTSGLEWNVKATIKDLPATVQKINATFESYWNEPGFERYDEGKKEKLAKALKAEKNNYLEETKPFIYDLKPYYYQQEILDKL